MRRKKEQTSAKHEFHVLKPGLARIRVQVQVEPFFPFLFGHVSVEIGDFTLRLVFVGFSKACVVN